MLKYHNLFLGIKEGLSHILFCQKSPSVIISKLFVANKKWGKKDRSFVAESIYDIVRWKAHVEAALNKPITPENLEKSIGVWFILKEKILPNFKEFEEINANQCIENFQSKIHLSEVKYSLSSWLYGYGKQQFGETKWHNELEALNKSARTVLRCNTEKITLEELQKSLSNQGIETFSLNQFPQALVLDSPKNILTTDLFKNGWFQIQDASSQLVAPFLQVKSGQIVIDACAGAGGKSLHLSNLMQNKGKIISLDVSPYKLAELEKRKKISGDKIIQTRLIQNNEVLSEFHQIADRVLIDAPCSSSGVMRRNPAIKWHLTQQKLNEITALQQELLITYSKFLQPSGLMVYATCSIFLEENQLQIQKFLEYHPDFSLLEEKSISPFESGFDGFYIACLQKN